MGPLVFEPILKQKVWGGDRLAALGKAVAEGARVGESWEIADLGSTSADGGGGDAARSVVREGPHAGARINELIERRQAELMGELGLSPEGGFPLLVKFLDAAEHLSVQTHPSVEYARSHPDAHLKTESWYVLDADEGAVIYKGVKPGTTREQFWEGIQDGSLVDHLNAIPVQPGDLHHLPSGAVHALGAGVVVAEVQTPSDTTFRVFDWGRRGRTLHIDQALECTDFASREVATPRRGPGVLVETPYYSIEEIPIQRDHTKALPNDGRAPMVLMTVAGGGTLIGGGGETTLTRGDTSLLPACAVDLRFKPTEDSTLLIIRFPIAS